MQTVTAPPPGDPAPAPAPAARPSAGPAAPATRRPPRFVLYPEDGIVTVLLLVAVVYTTIASIQAVTPAWAPGLGILTPVTLLGLVAGLLGVQQRVLRPVVVHALAVVLGGLLAFWETAAAVLGGDRRLLLTHLGVWLHQAITNQRSDDNTIFLLFLAFLSFLLAFLSVWLVIRARRPWLAVMANAVVLLINLNFATPDLLVFLIIFLMASLLLLVRFTLAENTRHWRASRLRFSPDLGWDFLQAGALFAVAVLLLAYLLPVAAPNRAINQLITNPNSALAAVQRRFEALFGDLNGPGGGGIGFFGGNLQLVGDVNLPNVEVMRYTSDQPSQYLITNTYDAYDGRANWTQTLTQANPVRAGATLPAPSSAETVIGQTVSLTLAGNGQRSLFAAGEPASFDLDAYVSLPVGGGSPTSWYAQRDLVSGQRYSATSYVSTATVEQLAAVTYPGQGKTAYPANVLREYANGDGISPVVTNTALQWAAGATSPYEAATDIEAHLRGFTFSYHNGTVPANQDAVVWFLQTQKGFCTFFASTMVLMMRSLGMPARLATGYTDGVYDPQQRNWVVRGTEAHAWAQLFFPGYGWINFEPTQSFQEFARGVPTPAAGASPTATTQAGGVGARTTPTPRFKDNGGDIGPTQTSPGTSALRDLGISLAFLAALALLVAAGFLTWWRALGRGRPPAARAFARTTRLGAWAGAPPARAQTPYEYADALSGVVPEEEAAVHGLARLYVGERWGGARATAEAAPLERRAGAALTRVVLRRLARAPLSAVASLLPPLRRRLERLGERFDRLLDAPFDHG